MTTRQSSGRHRPSPPHQGRRRIAAALALVSVLAVGAGLAIVRPWTGADAGTQEASGAGASGAAATGPGGSSCSTPLRIWTGVSNDPLVAGLTKASGSTCPVVGAASAAEADVALSTEQGSADGAVLGAVPVVLAMPQEMATLFGPLDTKNFQAWVNGQRTWAAAGKPDWGTFRLTLPDPATSPVGAAAYGGLLTTANGAVPTGGIDYFNTDPATLAMINVEHSAQVVPTDDGAAALLESRDVATFAKQTSAVLTTAPAVASHNARPGAVPFVAVPLVGGQVNVPLSAKIVQASPAAAALVKAWSDPSAASGIEAAGWGSTTTPPLSKELLAGATATWSSAHRRTQLLGLIDVSGSMKTPLAGAGAAKIDVVRQMVDKAYLLASGDAVSTIWFFNTKDGAPQIDSRVPLLPNKTVSKGVTHSAAVSAATKKVQVRGGTPLYLAIQKGYAHANANYREGYQNQVLVLTDGNNDDAGNPETFASTLAAIKAGYRADRPVSINFVLINPGSDLTAIKQLAKAAHGTVVPVNSTADLPAVFASAIFN